MGKKLYIAYGSNINSEQMSRRCPGAERIGTGILEGYRLKFRRVATAEPEENAETPVLAWKLTAEDEKNLDRYEGFPNFYRKENVVFKIDGEQQEAMVYFMNGNTGEYPPSREYYECIAQGYTENGMDTSYLREALKSSVESFYEEEHKLSLCDAETENYEIPRI